MIDWRNKPIRSFLWFGFHAPHLLLCIEGMDYWTTTVQTENLNPSPHKTTCRLVRVFHNAHNKIKNFYEVPQKEAAFHFH